MPTGPPSRPHRPLAGTFAVAAALLLTAWGSPQPADAHPAGACQPEIVSPKDGDVTSVRPTITARLTGPANCQIDYVQIDLWDEQGAVDFNKALRDCCDNISPGADVVNIKVPAGRLRAGAKHTLNVMYEHRHAGKQADWAQQRISFTTQSAAAGGSGSRGPYVSVEPNVDRPGSDYHDFDLVSADPNLCADACEEDSRCEAYTYVPRGRQGPSPRCWLKDGVPGKRTDQGMVSGVKSSPLPQTMNVDRPGSDFRNFDLSAPEPLRCAEACAGDSRCVAYTYVPPGRQGPDARCWLKDGVPGRQSDEGLVSGVK